MTGYGRRGTRWNWNNVWNFQTIRIFSTFFTRNFASIGAIAPLASFRNLVDMPSIDEVFLRLVIQAMVCSAQVPSRTKDLEMDFINVVKDVLVGRIPFPVDTPMEEKYS